MDGSSLGSAPERPTQTTSGTTSAIRGARSPGCARHFPLTFSPLRPEIPLYLGSIKPRSIETAGAIADDVLTGAMVSLA